MQELMKLFTCNRAFNDVMCNDAIKSDNREDREPLALHKALPLNASTTLVWLACVPVWCSFIFVHLITKHKHVRIGHKLHDPVHEYHPIPLITLQFLTGNILVCEVKSLESAIQSSNWCFDTMAWKQLLLDFIQVDCVVLVEQGMDKWVISGCQVAVADTPSLGMGIKCYTKCTMML